jgi:hypothetical protein
MGFNLALKGLTAYAFLYTFVDARSGVDMQLHGTEAACGLQTGRLNKNANVPTLQLSQLSVLH